MSAADRLLERLEAEGIRLGLEPTRALLAAMGRPQQRYPVVLVAGTNGKGTTAALLSSMTVAAGYRTGLYTSPHLESVEERIRVDGETISTEELGRSLERTVATAERENGGPPTYFEAMTVAAFDYFARRKVELAVVEVGLGGRLDATNVSEPALSLITDIGLDHNEVLGSSLAEIAVEKAGIMRRDRPALAWLTDLEAERAVVGRAAEIGARLELARRIATVESRPGPGTQRVRVRTPDGDHRLDLALRGAHQAANLTLAVLAAESLARAGWERLGPEAIAAGCAACRWPGRLERVELPDGAGVLLDVAHNPQGVSALARFLADRGRPFDLLFGVLGEKRVEEMLPPLADSAGRITLTAPRSGRAVAPADLLGLLPGRQAQVELDPGEALDRALAAAAGTTLVVCGSTYLVGEARQRLRQRFGVPPPAAGSIFADRPG